MAKHQSDLERTEELYDFLQGVVPEKYKIPDGAVPRLTPDQAWTVIWYLGNLYWQVTDRIERCDVCGELYDTHASGDCLDYGEPPHHFCDCCREHDQYRIKAAEEGNDHAPD